MWLLDCQRTFVHDVLADKLVHDVLAVNTYLFTVEDAAFVPKDRKEFEVLLRCFLLEKAVYEVGYELNNRPDWVTIPMRGIERLLKRA